MSPVRPDLVECFVFRVPDETAGPEFLLIRRAPGRIFAGLWQPVTGGLGTDETVPGCALREVGEEVGIGPADIVAFYDIDQATHFYDEGSDAIVSGAIFALRIRPDAEIILSDEHDDHRWVGTADAVRIAIWPSYRESITRIEGIVADPASASWFELGPDGRRLAR